MRTCDNIGIPIDHSQYLFVAISIPLYSFTEMCILNAFL